MAIMTSQVPATPIELPLPAAESRLKPPRSLPNAITMRTSETRARAATSIAMPTAASEGPK